MKRFIDVLSIISISYFLITGQFHKLFVLLVIGIAFGAIVNLFPESRVAKFMDRIIK